MERFLIDKCDIHLAKRIDIVLKNRPTTDKKEKKIKLYTGNKISLLYAECMADVGDNDKVYRGEILDIVYKPTVNIRQLTPNASFCNYKNYEDCSVLPYNSAGHGVYHVGHHLEGEDTDWDNIYIKMDVSELYNSSIQLFRLSHILDINPVDHKYPQDNPEIIECEHKIPVIEDWKMDKDIHNQETISQSAVPYTRNKYGYTK